MHYLDGFPEKYCQAESLLELFKGLNSDVHLLVSLDVPEEEIVFKNTEQGQASEQTSHNDESVIRGRYKVYEEVTDPVLRLFPFHDKASKVNGIGTIEEIFGRIVEVIDKHAGKE